MVNCRKILLRGFLFLLVGLLGLALACGPASEPSEPPPAASQPAVEASAAPQPAPAETAASSTIPAAETTPPTEAPAPPSKVEDAPEPTQAAAQSPPQAAEAIESPAPVPTRGEASLPCEGASGGAVGDCAPDFQGITNWINSDPLSIEDLRGQVVLVDVWTYTCINCIRTFPYLREWNSRYADSGLVIVGLHAPEFEFEKDTGNVIEAAGEHGIVWPIAQDNDSVTWNAYNNRYWPAKYLIDHNGVVRYTHIGEGAYAETEERIRQLLAEAGLGGDMAQALPQDQARDAGFSSLRATTPELAEVTRELYAGYERNYNAVLYGSDPYVVQSDYYKNRDAVGSFQSPAEMAPHKIYLNGDWHIGPESVKHARTTEGYEDYIAINYSAKSVNAVIVSDSGEPYRVRVTMDGEYLTEENKGLDVMIGDDGESFILVDEPRSYAIVDNPQYVRRSALRLHPNSPDFGLFAYTFGVYEEGP